ncbi:hypothetical protein Tco_0930943 [Tanacetum coccineum]
MSLLYFGIRVLVGRVEHGQRKVDSFTTNANEQDTCGAESSFRKSPCSLPLRALAVVFRYHRVNTQREIIISDKLGLSSLTLPDVVHLGSSSLVRSWNNSNEILAVSKEL